AKEIRMAGRITQGVRLIRLEPGDQVADLAAVPTEESKEESEVAAPSVEVKATEPVAVKPATPKKKPEAKPKAGKKKKREGQASACAPGAAPGRVWLRKAQPGLSQGHRTCPDRPPLQKRPAENLVVFPIEQV